MRFQSSQMKKFLVFTVAFFIGASLSARPDEPVPTNHSNYSWHTVTLVDYKPGMEESAKQLIQRFESASLAAGMSKPLMHWFETGKYDLVITWKLDNDPTDTQWTWSPETEEWWKALVTQEGSVEVAKRLQDEYHALIASSVTNLARKAK